MNLTIRQEPTVPVNIYIIGSDIYERNNTITGLVSIYADDIHGTRGEYF